MPRAQEPWTTRDTSVVNTVGSGSTYPEAMREDVYASEVRGPSQQGKMSLCWGTVKIDHRRGARFGRSLSRYGASAASSPPSLFGGKD